MIQTSPANYEVSEEQREFGQGVNDVRRYHLRVNKHCYEKNLHLYSSSTLCYRFCRFPNRRNQTNLEL